MTLLKYLLFPSVKLMNEFTFVVEKYTVTDNYSFILESILRISRSNRNELKEKNKEYKNSDLKLRACSYRGLSNIPKSISFANTDTNLYHLQILTNTKKSSR